MADFPASPAAALTCPDCGSAVRREQEWCTLCLRVLTEPIPSSLPIAPVSAQVTTGSGMGAGGSDSSGQVAPLMTGTLTPRAEAAAAALLEQLAADSRRDRLKLPAYLSTPARRLAAATTAMVVLCGGGLLLMTLLGSVF